MSSPLTFPLNPVDYVLLAKHELLQAQGYCGLSAMLVAEVEGRLDPDALREAVAALGRSCPALSARVAYSPVLKHPYWQIPDDVRFEDAIAYVHHGCAANDVSAWEPLARALDDRMDMRQGGLRLIHVQIGENFHRLALRWNHPLMDLEGGHCLLAAIGEELSGRANSLGRTPVVTHLNPFRLGRFESMLRAWQGRWLFAGYDSHRQPRIVNRPDAGGKRCRFELRFFDSSDRRRFASLAAKRISAGPLRYARTVLIGLARAYRQMATERGRPRSHYLFPLPLPLPGNGSRPGVLGNYVTIPFISFKSSELADWGTADAAVVRQTSDYRERHHDAAMWCMYRAASRWPLGLTMLINRHRRPRAAAGFTVYRFDDRVTRLGEAKIIHLSSVGAMDCHPGWMLGHMTYQDTMALWISYFEDYFDEANVKVFFDLLEREILE